MKRRKAYSVVSVLLLVELFAQFYFAAAGIFTVVAKADENANIVKRAMGDADAYLGIHAFNGTLVIPVTILVLIGLSFAARYPWRTTWLTAALFGLLVIQFVLAGFGHGGISVVAGLHGVNALLLVGLSIYLLVRNWAFGRQPAPVAEAAKPEEVAAASARA